jgi:hypothetical protein
MTSPNLFQMHMSEHKKGTYTSKNYLANIPAKMNIHSLNRRVLINYIRYSWKTDFMFNNLEVRDMPIYKREFEDKNNETTLYKAPMLVLMLPD